MKNSRMLLVVLAATSVTLLVTVAIVELSTFATPRLLVFTEKHTLAVSLGSTLLALGSLVVTGARRAMPKQRLRPMSHP